MIPSSHSPIHMSVLMRKSDLVRRYCCVLQVLESSVDLLNEDKMVSRFPFPHLCSAQSRALSEPNQKIKTGSPTAKWAYEPDKKSPGDYMVKQIKKSDFFLENLALTRFFGFGCIMPY